MPLINIPGQQLGFNVVRPSDCFAMCDGREEYCMPFQPGDPIMAQFKQTPCGPSITCDADFSAIDEGSDALPDGNFNAIGAEESTNGNFTGDAAGWTLGTGFAYNSNNVRKTAGSASALSEILPGPVVANGIYKVVFTVTNRTAGTLTPGFGFVVGAATVSGGATSSNATFTQYIKTGSAYERFFLLASSTFDGDIDTVSVKRIAPSWDFGGDEDEGWNIDSSGFAQTITGGVYDYSPLALTCPGVINPNTNYEVTVDVEDGEGAVAFLIGGAPIGMSAYYTLTGGSQTITFFITSGTGTFFQVIPNVSIDTKLKISNIAVVEVSGDCWDFDVDEWTVTTNKLCKTPGASAVVTNSATLTGGKKYQIKITVAGRTTGYINIQNDGGTSNNFDTNKTHVYYTNPVNDSTVSIFANNTFDGCISNLEIFEFRNDYLFELRDLDGNTIAVLDGKNVRYHDDYVTLKTYLDDIDGTEVELNKCYQIYCYDLCEIQYEEIIKDSEFANPFNAYWFDSGGSPEVSNTVTAGELIFSLASNPDTLLLSGSVGNKWDGVLWPSNPGLPIGPHNYHIEFDITENSDPDNITVAVQLGQGLGQQSLGGAAVGSYSGDVFNVNPANSSQQVVNIVALFAGVSGQVKIDNVKVHRIEPFDVTYISKCFKYAANFPCTKWIAASCHPDSFGFKFIDDLTLAPGSQTLIFELAHRVYIEAGNDSFPEETSDYLYSTGSKSRNFSQSELVYTIVTGLISREAHACIAKQRACQFFSITESNIALNDRIYYFCLPSDYIPEWNNKMRIKLASARFEVQERDAGVKFFWRV